MDKAELETTLQLLGLVENNEYNATRSINYEFRYPWPEMILDAYFNFDTEVHNIFVQPKDDFIKFGADRSSDHFSFNTVAEALAVVKEYIDFYKEHSYGYSE